jgi:16S rRNA G966 N2-methylase RsmD
MKYISLMNYASIKYIFNNKQTKYFVNNLLNSILNANEEYKLLPYFAGNSNIRSYLFFETNTKIIFMDFNYENNDLILNLDLDLINYLKLSNSKEIILIMFNKTKGKSYYQDNIYYFKQNNYNNNYVKLMLADNYYIQKELPFKDILDYLYHLDYSFLIIYQKELNVYHHLLLYFKK